MTLSGTFGIAVPNFTAYPEMPDIKALVEYGVRMEQMGFDSLWVWDHILLGVEPNFPIIESLTLLTAIAARTKKVKLGTGILVLPMRNPVILAKQLACMDLLSDGRLLMGMASGWYRREFNAIGVPFEQRGKIMDENLDILKRFWTEHTVSGKFPHHDIPAGVFHNIFAGDEISVTEADLAAPATGRPLPGANTVIEKLAFIAFHESYHVGQIGFIRKQLGHSSIAG